MYWNGKGAIFSKAIHLQKEDQELFVTLDYSQSNIKKIKEVTGKWNAERRQWVIPYSLTVIQRIFELFPTEKFILHESLIKEHTNSSQAKSSQQLMNYFNKVSLNTLSDNLVAKDSVEDILQKSEQV